MCSLDDTMKKTWMKILGIYILHLLFSFQNYSFLYANEKVAGIWAWIDPKYLVEFLVIGVVGCVFLCRQRVKEFSSNIFNRESLILLLINVVFGSGGNDHLESSENSQFEPIKNRQQPRLVY